MRHQRLFASALVLLLAAAPTFAKPYKLEAGAAKVTTTDEDWQDAKRERTIPVRIYSPEGLTSPAPVILLSHGLGGSREVGEFAASHWASYGYVVVAMQHAGSDEALWRGEKTQRGRMAALKAGATAENAILRGDDVHFVIDRLTELAKPGQSLAGKIDLDKIGMSGHSFGAQTTQMVIGQRYGRPLLSPASRKDDRIRAAIAFSPGYSQDVKLADWAFSEVTVPFLHFTGTTDTSIVSDMKAEQRRVPFDHIRAPGQRLITLEGGDHMVFSGRSLPNTDTTRYARFHDLIKQATTAFWDAELRGDSDARAWLATGLAEESGDDAKVEAHDE